MMLLMTEKSDTMTPQEIAEEYGLSRATVTRRIREWIDSGKVHPIGFNPNLKRQDDLKLLRSEIEILLKPKQ
jgi:DNA-binding Lrp family transcriptional regulator